jgi:mono/diheme cytochrome c family protein
MRQRVFGFGVAAAFALGLAGFGCGSSEPPAEPAESPVVPTPQRAEPEAPADTDAISATAVAKAEEIFATRCFTCHGSAGAGDGPASAGLTPRPRDFRDPVWQDSVSDDHLVKIISYGGAAVGKAPTMPGNPDLVAQRDVLAALAAHIRNLRASQPQS